MKRGSPTLIPKRMISSFRRTLAETIAWCRLKYSEDSPPVAYRSPELLPASGLRTTTEARLDSLPDSRLWRDDYYYRNLEEDRRLIVQSLCDKRSRLLSRSQGILQARAQGFAQGRLLACSPDGSVWDAASQAASEGFFDEGDLPPWDTWMLYQPQKVESDNPGKEDSHYTLFSWVPPHLIELVEEGIRANPVDCIQWASSLRTEFTRHLRSLGLIEF